MGWLRSIAGFKDYGEPRYREINDEAFELYKAELREQMYNTALNASSERLEGALGDLQESRGLQKDAYSRIANDGRSYVQEQTKNLLDRATGQTASLASNLPTGANTSALGRDVIRAQSDLAGQALGQAGTQRIAEERDRHNMLLRSSQGLSATDMALAGLASGQQQNAMSGLTNLSRMASELQAQREGMAMNQHLTLEQQRRAGIDSYNRNLRGIYSGLGQIALPWLGSQEEKK